ncbi:MAG: Spy/CpxP family protein refolding chaperone [Thermodesulfobacteriota bacterium]
MVKKIICFLWIVGLGLHLAGIEALSASPNPEPWAENLNLTPEQAQNLKELKSRFHQESAQGRKKIMMKRMELRTLTPEENKGETGEALRRQIQSLLLQAHERSLFYYQEALKVFTPEQREKLSPETDLGFRPGMGFRRGMGPGMGHGMGQGRRGPGSEYKNE